MREKKIFIFGIVLCIIGLIIGIIFILKNRQNKKYVEEEKWVLNGNVVSKGNQSYEIGDYFEYDETNNETIEDITNVKWKVMGVNSDGNLLILSASNVEKLTLGNEDNLEDSKTDYIEGISKLDEIAKKYDKGVGALSARSITNQDINQLTGYDPVTDYESYNSLTTYYWIDSKNPRYESMNNNSGTLKTSHKGKFIWYDLTYNIWMTSEKYGKENLDNPSVITTLLSNVYSYENSKLDEETNVTNYLIEENSKKYNMIYLDDEGENANYWTSDQFVSADKTPAFGYFMMKNDSLSYSYLVYSSGNSKETTSGVRVVITID